MKCPLLLQRRELPQHLTDIVVGDCLKGECAWWDADNKRCSVLTLARKSDIIHSILKDIRDKMPHIEEE